MAFHLAALHGHHPFLLADFLGLPGELSGSFVHLPGLLGHLRLTTFELRRSLRQGALELGDMPLPFDQLLTEAGHGEMMFVAGPQQSGLLLPELFALGADLDAQRFEVFLALTGVGVNLGELLAQLAAGLRESVGDRVGVAFQLGQLTLQQEDFLPGRLQPPFAPGRTRRSPSVDSRESVPVR